MRLDAAIRAETKIMGEIYQAEGAEYAAMRELADLETRLSEVQDRALRLGARVDTLDAELARLDRAVNHGVRYLYKLTNRANVIRMLLRSQSLESFLHRWRAVKVMTERDRGRLLRFREARKEIAETQAMLARDTAELTALVESARSAQESLIARRAKRHELLARIRSDRSLLDGARRAVDRDRAQAVGRIEKLTVDPPAVFAPSGATGDFASRQGSLRAPVSGRVVAFFGPVVNPNLGTTTRSSGIDIEAPEGTPVIAPADGVVRFAGELKGYGRVVVLDHGDRFHTLYGHLNDIRCKQGGPVKEGAIIGTVGATGSLSGARLHFEIRARGEAVDPMGWLAR